MERPFGGFLRARRDILGMSQRELSAASGVKQPLIAAIETGRRSPSEAVRRSLERAVALRPSEALTARCDLVRAALRRAGLKSPRLFGSVARGDDVQGSDVDLLVEFTDGHDIADLLSIEDELAELLTVRVDIVDDRGSGQVLDRARAEAVAL